MPLSINSTPDDYKQQLINLSPKGLAWPTEDGSNWIKLLDAIAQEFARVDARCSDLINEALPDTTTELLPNWEQIAGLPDECSELGDSYSIRRLNLIAKLASRGGQSPSYYISVALALGYEITVTEFDQFRADINSAGDPVNGEAWEYTWRVNAPLNSIVYFRASLSAAGEPLAEWGNDRLECVINKLKPAHTIVLFSYE
jgi:uncharacterized protein YmfQ (DUF2313 family)